MAPLHQANDRSSDQDDPLQIARNSRIGLRLFFFYFVFYAAFVLVNTFAPSWMEWTPISGVNLAIMSGMGLIGLAVLLAFVYGFLCRANQEGDR